ncbi:uncharacterized protein LOC143884761 [Tasmannia lanceolata]|uniref:uncharacterized protein LOC143884754 n=1 Tax=Tasmannia lanceolata TaxID=3420 RepID=UPI004063879D
MARTKRMTDLARSTTRLQRNPIPAPVQPNQAQEEEPPTPIIHTAEGGTHQEEQGLPRLERMMETLVGVVTQQQQQPQHHPPQVEPRQQNRMTEFRRMANTFGGTTDPLVADEWLQETEKIFEFLGMAAPDKVVAATFMLRGSADAWWKMEKRVRGSAIITWDEFSTAFYDKYFPDSVRILKENDFFNLKQGNRSVIDYEAEFTRLGMFAPISVMEDDGLLARRFQDGLREPIRHRVKDFQLKTYADVLSKALQVEEGVIRSQQHRDHQKKKSVRRSSG